MLLFIIHQEGQGPWKMQITQMAHELHYLLRCSWRVPSAVDTDLKFLLLT